MSRRDMGHRWGRNRARRTATVVLAITLAAALLLGALASLLAPEAFSATSTSDRTEFRRDETYRAQATLSPEGVRNALTFSTRRKKPLPMLEDGSRSVHVLFLERRLRDLGYRIRGIDNRFDFRTGDAVLAFHKVQGMPRAKVVTAATWRALADPIRPQPRSRVEGFHVEIDQTRQVLYTVEDGEITNVVHTSTGRNGATRDGVFTVHRKIAGHSPNRLWYPSYFDGLRAVHGWPEVPTNPASHGCSRVPNWTAVWLHDLMEAGTEVRIYHS